MKKRLPLIIIMICTAMIYMGCKKDNGGSASDYAASINDKTWWGMFTYAGDTTEYYSVHFNTDNSLTWNQLLGEYSGTWSLSGNHLTMDFGLNSIAITTDITNDNKLTNIKTNNTTVVNSGQLLVNPAQPVLDGTVWKGVFTDKIGSTYNMGAEFKSGGKVTIGLDGLVAETFSYTRSASGITIRAKSGSDTWFGVIMTDSKIIGTVDKAENKWEVTKQ
jgi:hypothetical protein